MKRTIRATLFVALIILSIATYFIGLNQGLSHEEKATTATYTAPCVVIEVDPITHWVTLEDWNRETWCIRDDSFEMGELVIVTFDDMGTISIYDDVIVGVARQTLVPIESID
jgi:hypothetical protein